MKNWTSVGIIAQNMLQLQGKYVKLPEYIDTLILEARSFYVQLMDSLRLLAMPSLDLQRAHDNNKCLW